MTESYVPKGYTLDKKWGVTNRERQVLGCLAQGMSLAEVSRQIGVSRQRVSQLARALEKKGVLEERDGSWLIMIPQA